MSITLSLPDRPAFGLSDTELLTHLDEITTAERRLAAARLETVAELCNRGIPATRGYAHPTAFLREHLKLHPAAAAQMHRLATTLPARPEIAESLAKGSISEPQAAVIATAVTAIAAEATLDEQSQAAELLLSQAAVLSPRELAVCGTRILHHVAPQTAEQRDRDKLEAAEQTAWQARAFTVTPDGHGRYRLRGHTTAEGAALLHTILDPLTHPRHHTTSGTETPPCTETGTSAASNLGTETNSGAETNSCTETHSGTETNSGAETNSCTETHSGTEASRGTETGTGTGTGGPHYPSSGPDSSGPDSSDGGNTRPAGQPDVPPAAFRDPRSAAQRRHDALLDALRLLLATDTLPDNGGSKPQVAVTVEFDQVTGRLSGGLLDTGAGLSAAEVRRMACDAGILPVVLDSHAVPLDLGRERRLITGGLRKALILRDRGCAFPGCDRPPRWCHAHHIRHWSDGGETCLTNSVLACGFHHRLLHRDDGWSVHIGADGHPWFTPPAHLDPQRTPRRNLYHQRD